MSPWPMGPRPGLGGWLVSLFCCVDEEGLYLVRSLHGRLRGGGLHPGETAVSGLWTDLSSWPGCPPWLLSDPELPAFSSRSGACVFVYSGGCWRAYLSVDLNTIPERRSLEHTSFSLPGPIV